MQKYIIVFNFGIDCGDKALAFAAKEEYFYFSHPQDENSTPEFTLYPNPTPHYSLLSTKIDISHLPAGIYFVRITSETGIGVKQ